MYDFFKSKFTKYEPYFAALKLSFFYNKEHCE